MGAREHRVARALDIRADADTPRMFEAVVMSYGVLDEYDTIFDSGVFADSLAKRLPRITWSHSWADVIGRYVDYIDNDDELTLVGELDDFDAVPRARQAYAQMRSGTIDQFSVGFTRDKVTEDDDGHLHFVRAELDEVALVLAGAVPGTKLLAVRSAHGLREVPEELVIDLARKVGAGELSQADAKIALELAAGESGGTVGSEGVPQLPAVAPDPTAAAELADADEALQMLGLA